MTTVAPQVSRVARSPMRFTRPLDAESDVALVGGKAQALGRAIRAGIRVPAGFALTTAAFDEHLDRTGLRDRIAVLLSDCDDRDTAALGTCASEIRALLLDTRLSPDLRDELFAHADVLLAFGAVVVRSSAVGEDSTGQSFAGQLDSILHVASPARLERAVLECWASYWSERALFYRAATNVTPKGMGVVVQHQVDARAAGVLFSDVGDGTMLVEYTAGLADALVSGAIDPMRASIDRATGVVRHVASPDDVGMPLAGSSLECLARTGESLENEFGESQDVEWAIDNAGEIWIVQSRPITAAVVVPRSIAAASTARKVSWSNANVNENFPGPISPLLYSIAAPGYTNYFRNLARAFGISRERIRAMEPAFRQIIGVHGARMYYNLTSIHSVLRLAPFGQALSKSFDTFVGAEGANVEIAPLDRRGRLRQMAEAAVVAAQTTWQFIFLPRRIARFESTVDAFAGRAAPERLAAMSATDLRDVLRGFMEIRCNRWLDASLADAASMVCYGALERLLKNAYGDEGRATHTALLKAIPDVISGEPVHRLWLLSRGIREDARLNALLEHETSATIVEHLRGDTSFAEFRGKFDAYLNDWGFRCSEELMLTSASFQENPVPLIDMLRAYAQLDSGSPDDALRAQERARIEETHRALAELSGRAVWRGLPAPTYAQILRVLLPWTHAAIRFRERARMKQALLYSRCRRIALAIGEHLIQRDLVDGRDDVFFLTVDEIDAILSGSAMFPRRTRDLVRMRRDAQARAAATTPPDAFTLPEGEYFGDGAHNEPAAAPNEQDHARLTGATLKGTSACAGRVTGRATVLRDVTEAARLATGDILVTKQTDPGWGPVFFLIAGLVIERGGMLSHGAIIAREFGIPCVVGVRDAMKTIPNGATIAVDADAGEVHVRA